MATWQPQYLSPDPVTVTGVLSSSHLLVGTFSSPLVTPALCAHH